MGSVSVRIAIILFVVVGVLSWVSHGAKLSPTFYKKTCPNVNSIVSNVVHNASLTDPRIGASLIRLHFHDCFVQGCDASLLLNNTATIESEQEAVGNNNSIRGLDVVNNIKTALENACPNTVSCADILAIAAQVSVVLAGGPSWKVELGRRDSLTANRSLANTSLPAAFNPLKTLKTLFSNQGLNTTDLVALSGAHTFGKARCTLFVSRLYKFNGTNEPDTSLNTTYLTALRKICPENGTGSKLANLDLTTPDSFDKNYYSNLRSHNGLLRSDQELFSRKGADTVDLVNKFSKDQTAFFKSFVESMIKMGNIKPLTGSQGQIRKQCNFVNSNGDTDFLAGVATPDHSHQSRSSI